MNQTTTQQSAPRMDFRAEGLRPKGSIPLRFGTLTGIATGGPFNGAQYWAGDDLTIKLAREINAECDVSLPIPDFSVPSELAAIEAITAVFKAFDEGQNVYAGCMAGQGRTGLFLALLVKIALDYEELQRSRGVLVDPQFTICGETDPVLIVRAMYYRHAVETSEQADFVRGFDTAHLLRVLDHLQGPAPAAEDATGASRGGWLARLWGSVVGLFTGRRAG